MAAIRRRIEVASYGVDEFLQTVGGDPYKGIQSMGMRIPALATNVVGSTYNRYLFQLCSINVPEGVRMTLKGIRQYVSIGVDLGNSTPPVELGPPITHYPMLFSVDDPRWHFVDADISWHLRVLRRRSVPKPLFGPLDSAANFAFRFSPGGGSALLYETATLADPNFYTSATAYVPPNGGQPWGKPVPGAEQLATFYDLRYPWYSNDAWGSMDVPIEGPQMVVLFASVKQTNTETRVLADGTKIPFDPLAIAPPEGFLQNFTTARYWIVGGAMMFEQERCD